MTISHNRAAKFVAQLVGDNNTNAMTVQNTAAKDTVTVTDNRSGKTFEIPIKNNTILASEFWKQDNLRMYDPGYTNTVVCTSRICYIDGPKGILLYRGIPIEQLASKSSFLEVAYLLMHGALPSSNQLNYFSDRIMKHTYVHEDLKGLIKSFRYDAHPMGMLATAMAAMGTLHPEANPALAGQDCYKKDKQLRNKQIHRLIGGMPTVGAMAYRQRIGRPFVDPQQDMGYAENYLYMMDKLSQPNYKPHPTLVRALDILFTLHADHELNCSTAAMRHLASSGVDVYTCVSGAVGALYGPSHGGANEAVLRMLEKIGSVDNIPAFIEGVKAKRVKLMGFGHRVYKNFDPRAKIIRKLAEDVFAVLGKESLIEVASALEKAALADEYFVKRNLYPNVDFYSGLIYKAMGFPMDYFTVLFAIPRTVGWLAHWNEFLDDKEYKIIRPRQVYLGEMAHDYTPMASRHEEDPGDISSPTSTHAKRRYA